MQHKTSDDYWACYGCCVEGAHPSRFVHKKAELVCSFCGDTIQECRPAFLDEAQAAFGQEAVAP